VEIQGFSAGREREPGPGFFSHIVAVRATGAAGLGAGAEGFVDDGLDGARASPAFGAAAEATVNLLGVARQISGRFNGATDIMVAQDVTGTHDHGVGRPINNADPSDILGRDRMQKEKAAFEAIPN
jgi:hypothetical protein